MRSTKMQRSWYWYDWANSAYITTTATVIIGPYLTSLANNAACPDLAAGAVCQTPVMLLGIFPVLPGALHPSWRPSARSSRPCCCCSWVHWWTDPPSALVAGRLGLIGATLGA